MINSYKERKAWVAGLISLILSPFISMLYLNKGKVAVLYAFSFLLFTSLPWLAVHFGILNIDPKKTMLVATLPIDIFGFFHSIYLAKKYDPFQDLKWYSKAKNIIVIFFVLPLIVSFTFRVFVFEPFYIPSSSMSPNINAGYYIYVKKYSNGYSRYTLPFNLPILKDKIFRSSPKRGDVIIFKNPYNTKNVYVKRLVGLPGDTIQIKKSRLYINGIIVNRKPDGTKVNEQHNIHQEKLPISIETLPNGVSYNILDSEDEGSSMDNTIEYKVPQNHYFALGDNRDNSIDSRILDNIGYIPENNIIAKASIIFWNGSKLQVKFIN